MANTSVAKASFVPPAQVVPPDRMDIPLRDTLTNLTPDELAGAILSTFMIESIMSQLVTVNTVIWQYWSKIFSKTKFDWELVSVSFGQKEKRHVRSSTLLNKRGKVIRKLSAMPLSLLEAVKMCEDDICDKEGDYGAENNLSRHSPRGLWDHYQFIDRDGNTEIYFQDSLSTLRKLGLSDDYVDYVKKCDSLPYAEYLEGKLRKCIAPTPQELQSIASVYTNNLDLLSRKDVLLVKGKNKPIITHVHHDSNASSISFNLVRWNNLTPAEREARVKKAYDVIDVKI